MAGKKSDYLKPLREMFDAVNFIVQFWVDPCDAPFTVWFETLWPALLNLLANYFAFDPNEIAIQSFKSSYRYKRIRTSKKGRPGRKNGKWKWVKVFDKVKGFDPNEAVGKKLFGWAKLKPAVLGRFSSILFFLEGVAERLVYWLWIIALVTNFFYNWCSLMIKTKYCQAKWDSVLLAHGPGQYLMGIFGIIGLNLSYIDKQRGKVTWNYSAGSFNTYRGACNLTATAKNVTAGTSYGVTLRLKITHFLEEDQIIEQKIDVPKYGSVGMSLSGNLTLGDHISVLGGVEQGQILFEEPKFWMQGNANKVEPDLY